MIKNFKAKIKNNRIEGITVPVHFFRLKKNGVVYAECAALRIVTYGRTIEKARKMFSEAYSLWKETVNAKEDAQDVLKNLGWQFSKNKVTPATQRAYKIPIHLLDSDFLNFNLSEKR